MRDVRDQQVMMQQLWARKRSNKKRQPRLPFVNGRNSRCVFDHFFVLRCANLLRNFSTRPPRESTLFWVPV